jgi:hypothetical protein
MCRGYVGRGPTWDLSPSRVSKYEIQLPRTAHRTSRPLHLRVVCHLKLGKARQPFFERHLHLHARSILTKTAMNPDAKRHEPSVD